MPKHLFFLLGIFGSCNGQTGTALTVDGTVNIGGSATATFSLAGSGSGGGVVVSDAGSQVFQMSPTPVAAGTTIRCEVTCSTSGESWIAIRYGSVPTTTELGTVSTVTGCPNSVSVTASSAQTGYTTVTSTAALTNGAVTCAEVPPTPSPTPAPSACPTAACFADESTVEVLGRGTVRMEDLEPRDRVLVGSSKEGKQPLYEEVYSFGHLDRETPTEYQRIHTSCPSFSDNCEPLEISAAHLLWVEGKPQPVRADSVRVGDGLVHQTLDSPAEPVVVTKVERVVRHGAYMPLTPGGYVLVNGIRASAYVSVLAEAPEVVAKTTSLLVSEHRLVHWWLAPYRMACNGMIPGACQEDYNEEGIAYWLVFGRWLAREGNRWSAPGQLLGLAVVGIFLLACVALEATLSFLPGLCLAVAVVGVLKLAVGRPHDQKKTKTV